MILIIIFIIGTLSLAVGFTEFYRLMKARRFEATLKEKVEQRKRVFFYIYEYSEDGIKKEVTSSVSTSLPIGGKRLIYVTAKGQLVEKSDVYLFIISGFLLLSVAVTCLLI